MFPSQVKGFRPKYNVSVLSRPTRISSQVQGFHPKYEVSIPSKRFPSQVQTLPPKYKVSVPSTRFPSQVQGFRPNYKVSIPTTRFQSLPIIESLLAYAWCPIMSSSSIRIALSRHVFHCVITWCHAWADNIKSFQTGRNNFCSVSFFYKKNVMSICALCMFAPLQTCVSTTQFQIPRNNPDVHAVHSIN